METIKIRREPTHKGRDWKNINASDFDPKVHERYDKPSSDPIVMAGESFVVDPSGAVKANSVTITDTVKGHKPRGRPKK